MDTAPAPTKLQMSDTSLKAHNDTNITHGLDGGNDQFQIDCDIPMQRVPLNDELPYDNDITMMDATNTPIHTTNGKHIQQAQHNTWNAANDVHNKENTKQRTTAATDLDRLIQKSDVQVYDEYEKHTTLKASTIKVCDDGKRHSEPNGSNGIDTNGLSSHMGADDIDMNSDAIDERSDECEQQNNKSDTLKQQARARSESPEPCDSPQNIQMRRQSQPVSEVSQFSLRKCLD